MIQLSILITLAIMLFILGVGQFIWDTIKIGGKGE